MTAEFWLNVLAPLILGGGVFTAINTIWQTHKKTPAEVPNIVATGAETAVLSLQRSLEAAEGRATRAEAEAKELRERVQALEERLKTLQAALDEAREELHAILSDHTKGDTK